MHPYRTHTCNELRLEHEHARVRLSGWVHRKRDHGNLLFIDLRDHYGITQCVIEVGSPLFEATSNARAESVVTVTGPVLRRTDDTINASLPTGEIEVDIEEFHVEAPAEVLPMQVAGDADYGEETRLRYRFLDLRREHLHRNIMLRSAVISSIRRRMTDAGFLEFQTPILTRELSRGCPRLPRAEPSPSRQVLCVAASTPAIQAAVDGLGIRLLLSNRSLLSR